jgi:hypothetical protein
VSTEAARAWPMLIRLSAMIDMTVQGLITMNQIPLPRLAFPRTNMRRATRQNNRWRWPLVELFLFECL